MAQEPKKQAVVPAGQEDVQALTTENSVVDGGTLVRPKEDTVIYGTSKGDNPLGDGVEHTVHRVLAEKLISKGFATKDKPKAKKED